MKLVLKEKNAGGAGKPTQWSFEHGSRVIGRSSDCDWQVDDDARRVSKVHCTLNRDREGFTILDRSANGTQVDGRLLLEGQTARLNNGSQIGIGGQVFEAVITGEAEMDFGDPDTSLRVSDESMTISAILADIAPNGRSARGVIAGGAANDEWPEAVANPSGNKSKSISRNVEIGWNAPPATSGIGVVLPNDWDKEPDESSKHEHTDALNIPVMVTRPKTKAAPEDFDAVFTDANDKFEIEEPQLPVFSPAQDAIDDLLVQLEKETAESLAVLDIDHTAIDIELSDDTARGRIESLIRQQRLLASTLETLIQTCTRKLEPRLVEAMADAQNDWRAKIERKEWRSVIKRTDYWSAYKQQFEQEGRQLSVRQFLQRAAQGDVAQEEATSDHETDTKGVSRQDEA
jgi:type VI secretion system protein ImpI